MPRFCNTLLQNCYPLFTVKDLCTGEEGQMNSESSLTGELLGSSCSKTIVKKAWTSLSDSFMKPALVGQGVKGCVLAQMNKADWRFTSKKHNILLLVVVVVLFCFVFLLNYLDLIVHHYGAGMFLEFGILSWYMFLEQSIKERAMEVRVGQQKSSNRG